MYALSPKVEQIAPPLIFVDGRAYRLAPSVVATLTDLTGTDGHGDPDPRIAARLLQLGILVRTDVLPAPVQPNRVRHPLAIHVRSYSTTLLRIFERAGILYPLRNTLQATLAIVAGITVFGWILRDVQHDGGVGGLTARITAAEVIAAVACTMLAMIMHEAAHVDAARRAGCKVSRAGLGIYLTNIVCFVDLSNLTEALPARRRHVDIAGMAADSILLIGIWAIGHLHLISTDLVALVAISYISGLLFSLNPWIKSDGYWLLRDSYPPPMFDPSNWLLQPHSYIAHVVRPTRLGKNVRLLRVHCAVGLIWLVTSLAWTATVFASFLTQPNYSSQLFGHWLMTAATLMLTLIGLSAVALALLKGSQWRNS